MGNFVKGDVVILPFPFTNLSGSKKRPALVISKISGVDVILCMITSSERSDSIPLVSKDFSSGKLPHDCYIRPTHIFTADSQTIAYKAGEIKKSKINEVVESIVRIIRA